MKKTKIANQVSALCFLFIYCVSDDSVLCSRLPQKPQIIFVEEPDAVDAIAERDREFDAEFIQANSRRPLGLGIGRPNSLAVSIHSLITTSTLLSAACRVGPSAAQPGNSGTSAMNASSSALQ